MRISYLSLTAILLLGCKTTSQPASDQKAIYQGGIEEGEAIGPLVSAAKHVTLVVCRDLDVYEAAYAAFTKNGGILSQGCSPLQVAPADGQGMPTILWFDKEGVAAYKKQIFTQLWKHCLNNDKAWFCIESKIAAEVDAAFSPGPHVGKIINSRDWLQTFWNIAQQEAKTAHPCVKHASKDHCESNAPGRCVWRESVPDGGAYGCFLAQ